MNPKVIFVPNSKGSPNNSFYRKVGDKLSDNGFEIFYLNLLDKDPIDGQNWLNELEKLKDKIDGETYIVAHSSGNYAVARFLSDNNLQIKAWHIVAGGFDEYSINASNKDYVIEQAQSFKPTKEQTTKEAFNWSKIESQVERIVLHYSDDDAVVNLDQMLAYRQVLPGSVIAKYENKGHFDGSSFDELVDIMTHHEQNSWTILNGEKLRVKLLQNDNLPLVLPEIDDYLPGSDGRSPLSKIDWSNLKDPLTGQIIGHHESDTMPNWAGSSWYYLRYTDPKNENELASKDNLKYWLPVDHYFGGNEHTTLHLLYSRFWHKFLHDQGHVPTAEPYIKRTNGGILLGPDGQKMSKSKGNVVNIKEKLEEVGADAVRMYIAFIGPYDATVVWNDGGLKACRRVVDSIFNLSLKVQTPLIESNQTLEETKFKPKEIEISTQVKNELDDLVKKYKEEGRDIVLDGVCYNPKGQIFVQKRASFRKLYPNQWDVAGGHMEDGENPTQTIKREVKEETGLDVVAIEYVLGVQLWDKPDGTKAVTISTLDLVEGDFENPQVEYSKISQWKWLEWQDLEILKQDLSEDEPFIYNLVKKAFEYLNPRKHIVLDFDGVLGDTWQAYVQTYSETNNISLDEASELIVEESKQSLKSKTTAENKQEFLGKISEANKRITTIGFDLFTDFINELKKIPNAIFAVVSTSTREHLLEKALQNCELEFTHVLGVEDDVSKEVKVNLIAREWLVSPKDLYFFTDTVSDVLELRETLDESKIFGCSWGWHGTDMLKTVLADSQILKTFEEIHLVLPPFDLSPTSQFYHDLLIKADLDGFFPSINAVITNSKGEIYTQKRSPSSTIFPEFWEASVNGKVETSENLYEALEREIKEETGWNLKRVVKYLGAHDWVPTLDITPTPQMFKPHQRSFSFWVEVEGDFANPVIEQGKITDFKWVGESMLDIFSYNSQKGDKWTVQTATKVLQLVQAENLSSLDTDTIKTTTELTEQESKKLLSSYHKFVRNVTNQLAELKNNVAVAEIMSFVNLLKELPVIPLEIWQGFLQVIAPIAPHTAEELWYKANNFDSNDYTKSIHLTKWPGFDPLLCIEDTVTIAVQVNGKLRATFEIAKDSSDDEVLQMAKDSAAKWLEGVELKFSKVIPNKLVTLVVK